MGTLVITQEATAPTQETWTATAITDTNRNVTYTFSAPHTVGRYWNGSPFVVSGGGDVTITQIDPASQSTFRAGAVGRLAWIHGAMINPALPRATTRRHGFDDSNSSASGVQYYNHALNQDPGALGGNLVIAASEYPNGASIVKAVSNLNLGIFDGRYIDRYSILTVVPTAPAANAFRPPPCATNKSLGKTLADLDFSKLQRLSLPASFPSVIGDFSAYQHTVIPSWHDDNDATNNYTPQNDGTEFGYNSRDQRVWQRLMAMLHSNAYTDAEKQPYYAALTQIGLDMLYGVSDGGLAHNVSWTKVAMHRPLAVWAAVALDDAALKATAGLDAAVWPDTTTFGRFVEGNVGVRPAATNKNSAPPEGALVRSYNVGDAWSVRNHLSSPMIKQPYFHIHTAYNPYMAILMQMLGNGEGRTVWGNDAFFEMASRFGRVFDINVNGYNAGDARVAEDWQLAFLASNRSQFDSTTAAFRPEEYAIEMGLTFGSTTLDVNVLDPIFPGSTALSRIDLRVSTDGSSWTTATDTGKTHQFTGLSAETFYYCQVNFVNTGGGESGWSPNVFTKRHVDIIPSLVSYGLLTQAEYDAIPDGGETDPAVIPIRKTQNYFNNSNYIDICNDLIAAPTDNHRDMAAWALTNCGFTTA